MKKSIYDIEVNHQRFAMWGIECEYEAKHLPNDEAEPIINFYYFNLCIFSINLATRSITPYFPKADVPIKKIIQIDNCLHQEFHDYGCKEGL